MTYRLRMLMKPWNNSCQSCQGLGKCGWRIQRNRLWNKTTKRFPKAKHRWGSNNPQRHAGGRCHWDEAANKRAVCRQEAKRDGHCTRKAMFHVALSVPNWMCTFVFDAAPRFVMNLVLNYIKIEMIVDRILNELKLGKLHRFYNPTLQ